jgi:hypothetical protein
MPQAFDAVPDWHAFAAQHPVAQVDGEQVETTGVQTLFSHVWPPGHTEHGPPPTPQA